MGGFENRPENWRAEDSETGAAQNALWNVTQQLQNLQQNLLSSMQSDVTRLSEEKSRLTEEIRRLQEEKDNLQQVRHITEQQVLMRQLGQVLANHISSELQSSLTKLANQAVEGGDTHNQGNKQASFDASNFVPTEEIERNVERMLGNLDDTLTISLNSLQQELSNYQSNLSLQLSRMRNQQQQGELLLAELVSRLRTQLEAPTSNQFQTASRPEAQASLRNQFQEISSPLKDIFETNQSPAISIPEVETTPIVPPVIGVAEEAENTAQSNNELEITESAEFEDNLESVFSLTDSENEQEDKLRT
ncbi:MAG: hypothetical protein HC908_18590 [Calothrix sp. SM1_7_51]|nr:hypothetical protein [Calothrix sp. SM1_7_51]